MTPGPAKGAVAANPWVKGCFKADYGALQDLLSSKLVSGKWPAAAGGALGKALDRWVADELLRAGYEANSVWPRPVGPAYLPFALGKGLTNVPVKTRDSPEVRRFVTEARKGIGPRPGVVGEFYRKQIDVLVSDWDRGVEVLVSTKSMTSSFAKNINNRWEEFVGEVRNFRGRYPLASLGVLYLADTKVVEDRAAYDRLVDMLRKLRNRNDDRSRFDATGLVLVRRNGAQVLSIRDAVPPDLRADCFFQRLLVTVFASVPVQDRARARSMYDASIPTKDPALGSTTAQSRVADCGCV